MDWHTDDKEAWLEVGDFSGWAVVECNCTLITQHSSVEQKLPRQSHNLEIASANLAAATIEVPDALENNNQRYKTDGKEQPADSAGLVINSQAMFPKGFAQSATLTAEPTEVTTQGE